jgi:hypothetical protein
VEGVKGPSAFSIAFGPARLHSALAMSNLRDLAQRMAEKSEQELLAMFALPEDWTAEALDAAKAELQKRGLNSSASDCSLVEPERPEDDGHEDRPDVYEFFGAYSTGDARLLMAAFIREGVDYTLHAEKMGIADMSAFQAANGGTFGAGVGVAIGVHIEHCDRAMEIRQRVLKIVL